MGDINPGVSTWTAARSSANALDYKQVVEMARAEETKPDLKALSKVESCCDFPASSNIAIAARCKKESKYETIDLKNMDLGDAKQKQCTQLGFQCDVCNLCVAFDGGLKPEKDGKYHGFCNKKCRKPSTFKPVVGPSDLMGICYGFNGAAISTYASTYAYNDKYLAIHDFGNLAPVHFLIIPTKVAIPDVMSLCVDPNATKNGLDGPRIVWEMKEMALNIFRKMCGVEVSDDGLGTEYAPNLQTLGQIYGLQGSDQEESAFLGDGLPNKMIAVFNMPVSQNQLHLHIIVLPFFKSQMEKAFQRNPFDNWCHWGWPRTVPLKLVERVVAGVGLEAGGEGGELMSEAEARRIVGDGDGLENKEGSDWYEYCWRRVENARDWTSEPFLEADSARNDQLVLPFCFYHGAKREEDGTMEEWLGSSYRSDLEKFNSSLGSEGGEAKDADAKESTLDELVTANVDGATGLITNSESYVRLLSKTSYMPPKPNVATEYFVKRLTCIPAPAK
jgi:hypothetical protein